eukprot:904663-Prymnesium_polylepis.1
MRSPSRVEHPWRRSRAAPQTAPCCTRPAPCAPPPACTAALGAPAPARCRHTAPRRPPGPCAARASSLAPPVRRPR